MVRKLTIEEVRVRTEALGCKLLSTEWHGATKKIEVECPQGHQYEITASIFFGGSICRKCSNTRQSFGLENAKQYIESFGYQLLSKEYVNRASKLDIECDKGHLYQAVFGSFKAGHRCPVCAGQRVASLYKLSLEEVKTCIEAEGYKLLSTEYINAKQKLALRCAQGHEYSATFDGFKQGKRCAVCQKRKKRTIDEVRSLYEKEGYTLASEVYQGANKRIDVICPQGHQYTSRVATFRRGVRCPSCQGLPRRTFDEVKSYFEKFKYKLLSDSFQNATCKLEVQCPEGHQYFSTFENFRTGKRCDRCQRIKCRREKHPRWNHEKTDEERLKDRRYSPLDREWRIGVYKKYDQACQCCFQRFKDVQAHHIYSYADHPELRLHPENGITLCKKCHKEFHLQFGRGKNTKEQLERFLGREIDNAIDFKAS